MRNADILEKELRKLIEYQIKENDLSLAEVIGVLEIQKHDLIAYAFECARKEKEGDA